MQKFWTPSCKLQTRGTDSVAEEVGPRFHSSLCPEELDSSLHQQADRGQSFTDQVAGIHCVQPQTLISLAYTTPPSIGHRPAPQLTPAPPLSLLPAPWAHRAAVKPTRSAWSSTLVTKRQDHIMIWYHRSVPPFWRDREYQLDPETAECIKR
jgi:hypothetical protein